MVAGVLLSVGIGLIAIYTSYTVGQVCTVSHGVLAIHTDTIRTGQITASARKPLFRCCRSDLGTIRI